MHKLKSKFLDSILVTFLVSILLTVHDITDFYAVVKAMSMSMQSKLGDLAGSLAMPIVCTKFKFNQPLPHPYE